MLLVAAAPDSAQRHAATGHFNVPQWWIAKPVVRSANAITNATFESGAINDGWYQCGDVEAYVSAEHPYRGSYDEYSGTRTGFGEPRGNSGVCQRVTIPPSGVLTARLYQLSNEENVTYAYQEADLLDDRGNVVVNLYRAINNKAAWVVGTWNLAAYAKRTLWLYFGIHGDGYSKLATQQFVDDVLLTSPGSPSPK